jgi:hypothetical protein
VGIIGWIFFGLLAGLVARAPTPGRHSIGCFGTLHLAQDAGSAGADPASRETPEGPLARPAAQSCAARVSKD